MPRIVCDRSVAQSWPWNGSYGLCGRGLLGCASSSVADPRAPVRSTLWPNRWGAGAWPLERLCLHRAYKAGLVRHLVSDPARPVQVGHCDTPGWSFDVALAGDYAYVAADTTGLRVISVADRNNRLKSGTATRQVAA